MTEEKKFLAMLQVTVPADTALTVTSQIKILQMLGIVSNPALLHALDIAATLIPASTPATLHGLFTLLTNLVRRHPDSKKEDHDELSKVLKNLSGTQDAALTYGAFLPICEALLVHKPEEKPKRGRAKSEE